MSALDRPQTHFFQLLDEAVDRDFGAPLCGCLQCAEVQGDLIFCYQPSGIRAQPAAGRPYNPRRGMPALETFLRRGGGRRPFGVGSEWRAMTWRNNTPTVRGSPARAEWREQWPSLLSTHINGCAYK